METLLLGFLLVSNLVLLGLAGEEGLGRKGRLTLLKRDFFASQGRALVGALFFLGRRNFGKCRQFR